MAQEMLSYGGGSLEANCGVHASASDE